MPLRRIYLLDADEAPDMSIRAVSRREAAIALVSHSYHLDVEDRSRMAAHFVRAADACGSLDIRRLVFPHRLGDLAAVRAAILEDLDA
jgi:hypothetical protein